MRKVPNRPRIFCDLLAIDTLRLKWWSLLEPPKLFSRHDSDDRRHQDGLPAVRVGRLVLILSELVIEDDA